MFNRITTNIKQSNNPEDRWDADEVNLDLTRLDTNITQLSDNLVTTDTSQTVNGQKTLFNLFIDPSSGYYTYDSIMNRYPFDISPMFGAATYGFTAQGAFEEGRYEKKNPSGTVMNLAALNPSFMPSDIVIDVTGTDTIRVKALNVPLPLTTLGGSYSESDSNMTAYIWKTSVSIDTSFTVTGLGTSNAIWHTIYLNYNPETDSASIDLSERSDLSSKVLTRCIGAVISKNSALFSSYQSRGIIHFREVVSFGDLRWCTGGFNNRNGSDKILNTSILKITEDGSGFGDTIRYSGGFNYFNENEAVLNSIENTSTELTLYIPIHKDGAYLTNASTSDTWQIEEINFGDLAI